MDHPIVPLSYDLLKEITNDFSEERKIGSGSYGRVYKGVHKDGKTIAVKLLYDMPGLDDEQFKREFNNLTSLQHDNIVRLVGYCHETRQECAEYNGRPVVADRIRRALCFEYAYNGNLHDNLSDEYNGHDWGTRYGIIKGICNGLKYLHQVENMYHLDIKPANVLLDENMLPKIADFGLSRLFGQEQTKITKSLIGTRGYLPPEYIEQNVISNKFDIFSLGVVIIKVMAGPKGYSRCADMSSLEFINLVHGNWRDRLQAPSMYKPELYYEQVKTCIEIGLRCVETDRHRRPIITDIVDKMNETETNIRLWSHIEEISPIIEVATDDFEAVESAFRTEIGTHSSNVSVKRVNKVEEGCGPIEKRHVIREKDASTEQPTTAKQESEEDTKQNAVSDSQLILRRSDSKEDANVVQGFSGNHELGRGTHENIGMKSLVRDNKIMDFKLSVIKTITSNFSEDQKIGSGLHGDVYKAVYNGEEIAFKKLHPFQGLDDKKFHSELLSLTKVSHKNIVRLIGYCYQTRHKCIDHRKITKSMERVLSFEYIQGGNLQKHIADEACELDWPTCYKIIRGTCEGLDHLHSAPKNPIFHLDLKPANILLDKSMTPKIADLGLSRIFLSSKTHEIEILKGAHEYMPPEYIDHRFISKKLDVFSFGVIIIKIVAGNNGYFHCSEMSPEDFTKLVTGKWRNRFQAMTGLFLAQETDILQVKTCVEIALRCVVKDREKRPCVQDIVQKLEELEAKIEKMSLTSSLSKDLTVQRSRIDLLVEPPMELWLVDASSSCMQITNKKENYIAFQVTVNQTKYRVQPSQGILRPFCKRYFIVTKKAQENTPPSKQFHDMLLVQSAMVSEDLAAEEGGLDYQDLFETAMEENVLDVMVLPIVHITSD